MPELTYVDRNGVEKTVSGDAGYSVMEVLRENGVDGLFAVCGGSCSCATCHVHVDPEWTDKVGKASSNEQDLLELSDHLQDNSRLSCQIRFSDALDGLKLIVAPED